MKYKYKFSVVVSVDGAGEHLRETLDSVTGQDIGFEKNIQMILVGGGSSGESEKICMEYQSRYPQNIVFVRHDTCGAAAVGNCSRKHILGKYVNFLDTGGRWSPDSFRIACDYWEKHYDKIDLVSCRLVYDDGGEGAGQWMTAYGKESRIIDILDKYTCIQTQLASSFVKAELLSDDMFDENLSIAAGAKFVNSIFLDKRKYGVVAAGCLTCYGGEMRSCPVRSSGKTLNGKISSGKTSDGKTLNGEILDEETLNEWYFDIPEHYYLDMIEDSIEKYGVVIPYIQYLIMYEFQWRLREDVSLVLAEEAQERYENCLKKVLSYMDDDMICRPDKMYAEYRIYALSLKYGRDIRKDVKYRKGALYFNHIRMYSMQAKSLFSVDVLDIRDGMLNLSGRIWCPFADDIHFYIESDDGKQHEIISRPAGFRKSVIFGKEMIRVRGYEVQLPLEGVGHYAVCGCYKDMHPQKICFRTGKFSHLSQEVKELYYHDGGYTIRLDRGGSGFLIRRKSFFSHAARELSLLIRCMKDKKYEIAGYRILSRLVKPFLLKERWLIMERINVAGDNAEHFYRFLKKHEDKDIKSLFVISRDSADYERMKQIGKVIPFRGFRHKLNVLLTKNIISSQGEDNIFNPWDNDSIYIRDRYKYNFVFLQHGIIKDDLSEWLNKFNKNLQMFVTSAKPEYESILKEDYFYDKKVVKLTGLPRYDNLKQGIKPEKSIIFMPTWRYSLACRMDNDTGERIYNPLFKQSAFFRFYNALINDERLIQVLKRKGYTGKFFLHAHHQVQSGDFTDNDTIRVVRDGIDYQKEFQENALLITDFSSVAFDFAYLKKPVIYTHFDIDTFFEGQIYTKGYFEYERDGMGPVCYDYETTLQTIIDTVENDCRLDPLYDERGNRFYNWFDENNCRRVYDAIRSLDRG